MLELPDCAQFWNAKLKLELILDVAHEILLNWTLNSFGKIPIVVGEHVDDRGDLRNWLMLFAWELHCDVMERLQDGDEGFDEFPVSICEKLKVSFTKILDLKNDDNFF